MTTPKKKIVKKVPTKIYNKRSGTSKVAAKSTSKVKTLFDKAGLFTEGKKPIENLDELWLNMQNRYSTNRKVFIGAFIAIILMLSYCTGNGFYKSGIKNDISKI